MRWGRVEGGRSSTHSIPPPPQHYNSPQPPGTIQYTGDRVRKKDRKRLADVKGGRADGRTDGPFPRQIRTNVSLSNKKAAQPAPHSSACRVASPCVRPSGPVRVQQQQQPGRLSSITQTALDSRISGPGLHSLPSTNQIIIAPYSLQAGRGGSSRASTSRRAART